MKENSKKQQAGLEVENKRQFCTFWIFGRLFGVDILSVKEISTQVSYTPIYHAPEEVKGYVNIRGQIYLVIDLRLLLRHEEKEIAEKSQIVIFKNSVGESFGVLVDEIGDVIEVEEDKIEEYQKFSDGGDNTMNAKLGNLTSGVCRLEDKLLVILEPRMFLPEIGKLLETRV